MLDPREIQPESTRPITRLEYERIVEIGMFEDERVELLDGVIVQMSPHSAEHDSVLSRLMEILVRGLADRAAVRVQSSFAASPDSEPEPDLAVVPRLDYDANHPNRAWLIIEVARTSLAKDRGPKARIYAEAHVPEYWVVNLEDRVIEVHTEPREGLYRQVRIYTREDHIQLQQFSDLHVDLAAVLRS